MRRESPSRFRSTVLGRSSTLVMATLLIAVPSSATSAQGEISTVAGEGTSGFGGDGGAATSAMLNSPSGLAITTDGGFLIADTGNHRIRKVLNSSITTVAGTGSPGSQGGPGHEAILEELNS